MKQKMKWVSKYISRPLLLLMLVAFLVYKFSPNTYQKLGIDMVTLGKIAFMFFLIKGILWLVVIAYAVNFWRKKKAEK